MSKGVQADQWVSSVSSVIGGRGGGKATTAQASGTKTDKLNDALRIARQYIDKTLTQ